MKEDRNMGVSEARYALSMLFCVLLGLGFLLLNQLGGTADAPTIESPPNPIPPIMQINDEPPPQVLTIEDNNGPVIQTSLRPEVLSPIPIDSTAPGSSDPADRR